MKEKEGYLFIYQFLLLHFYLALFYLLSAYKYQDWAFTEKQEETKGYAYLATFFVD